MELPSFLGGNAVGGMASGMVKTTFYGFVVIVGLALIVLMYFWLSNMKRFTYTCEIHEKRSESFDVKNEKILGNSNDAVIFDKGGYFFDKKVQAWRFRFKIHKLNIDPPDFKYVKQTSKGGKLIYFRKISASNIIPIMSNIIDTDLSLKIIDPADKLYASTEILENAQVFKRPSFWEKFLPLITVIVVGMVIMLMLWVVMNKFGVLQDISQNLKDTANALKQCR